MNIEEHQHGAVIAIKPVGPVTKDDVGELRSHVLDVKRRSMGRVVVDASAIPFIDSAGLTTLLDVNDEFARSGQALKLGAVNKVVREVLDLTELASSFEIFEDVNSAVRSFL